MANSRIFFVSWYVDSYGMTPEAIIHDRRTMYACKDESLWRAVKNYEIVGCSRPQGRNRADGSGDDYLICLPVKPATIG